MPCVLHTPNRPVPVFSIVYNRYRQALKFGAALLIFLSIYFSGKCQQSGSAAIHQQVTFACDNNFFLFNGDDGYYTSGMFLTYERISRKQSSPTSKKIFSYEIGQEIYNAHSRKILPIGNSRLNIPGGIEQIDRPIAGYLFGKVSRSTFYNDRKVLTLGISIGCIGENSFGRNVQEFWHRTINVKDYWNWVWDYQVHNELGINIHGMFAQSLIKNKQHSYFQITPITQAALGTTFTNLSQAFLLQIGKLRPLSSSSYWHSRLQLTPSTSDGQAVEWFLFYKPEIKYQLYNATIQGGLLTSDKGPILSDVESFVLSHDLGVQFSVPRFSIGYHMVFQSREAKSQFYPQSFASVVGSFCF